MLLLSGLPGDVLRRPRLPADGLAPQAPAAGGSPARAGVERGRQRLGRGAAMTQATQKDRAIAAPIALTRRRAMTILGMAAGLPLLCAGDRAPEAPPLYR